MRSRWRIYFLVYDFSSYHHNSFRDRISKLEACRKGWSRSILFDRTKILSVEQACYRPNTPCFDVSSIFFACSKQDAVHSGRLSQDLCVLCSYDSQAWRILSVFCSNFVLLVSILNSCSVMWLHIRCDKCTRRNRSELKQCPVMRDQWDCVLNDLEELGDKEFLVLMDRYKIEIFSCFLRILPLCSSTFHQTNVEIAQNGSDDNLLISRIQSLHHLLEVNYHDEEEWSVASTLENRWRNNLVVQYRSKFFPQWVQFLWMSWQKYVFVVLLWPLIGSQKQVHSISTHNLRTASLRFPARCRRALCCSNPWEILTH